MPLAVPLLVLLSVAISNAVESYTQLPTITIPGDLAGGNDISWVDPVSGRYYLDRTTGSVDVVAAEADKYLYSIKGFVGAGPSGRAGPDGVLTLGNELWAGDGNSTVKVVDLTQGAAATPFSINTGGTSPNSARLQRQPHRAKGGFYHRLQVPALHLSLALDFED
jgi:hypothetical protein